MGDIAAVAVLRPTAFRMEAKDGVSAVNLHDAEVVEVPAGASGRPPVSEHQLMAQIALSARLVATHQH